METQKMTLARLLRYKNNVVAAISECQEQIRKNNSVVVVEGYARDCDVKAELGRLEQLLAHLLAVKALKMRMTAPIQWRIFELSELKSQIRFLQTLNTTHGPQAPSFRDDASTVYDAVLRHNDVMQSTRTLQKKIDQLQTEIDTFNADTIVEVPVCAAMP